MKCLAQGEDPSVCVAVSVRDGSRNRTTDTEEELLTSHVRMSGTTGTWCDVSDPEDPFHLEGDTIKLDGCENATVVSVDPCRYLIEKCVVIHRALDEGCPLVWAGPRVALYCVAE